MADRTFDYTVRVTVDDKAWQDATGARPEPYIQQMIYDLFRPNELIVDIDVRIPEPSKVTPKYEEI